MVWSVHLDIDVSTGPLNDKIVHQEVGVKSGTSKYEYSLYLQVILM